LCATQGADFRGREKLGKGTKTVYSLIRRLVPMLKKDRPLSKDVEIIVEMIRNGQVKEAIKPYIKN
jgi:histidine ammonia-lyase